MTRHLLATILALSLPLTACDKEKDAPAATDRAASPAAALDSYESIRALLAGDSTEGLADKAKALSSQARAAAGAASGEAKKHLEAIAGAADGLADKGSDIAAARAAFGEVSRHVVGLLSAQPDLQKGRHVFECPMAEGYKKWVQTEAELKNPYMGKKMLECGSESDWGV